MEYDIMKDLSRIVRRRSKPESPQARYDRLHYYAYKWERAYFSGDPVLQMCAVMILAALDAPEVLAVWQHRDKFTDTVLRKMATDPE